jgi:antirestriction protein
MSEPRVYFADLAAYNNGRLRGVWVDFFEGITAEEVQFAIDFMLAKTEGEEWRIDDIEGFAGIESSDLDRLCAIANLIHEHGEGAIKGYLNHRGSDADLEEFAECYIGCYQSEADFCEKYLGEDGGICAAAEEIQVFDWATLDLFIDWDAIARDAFINLYYSYEESYQKVHVYIR